MGWYRSGVTLSGRLERSEMRHSDCAGPWSHVLRKGIRLKVIRDRAGVALVSNKFVAQATEKDRRSHFSQTMNGVQM